MKVVLGEAGNEHNENRNGNLHKGGCSTLSDTFHSEKVTFYSDLVTFYSDAIPENWLIPTVSGD